MHNNTEKRCTRCCEAYTDNCRFQSRHKIIIFLQRSDGFPPSRYPAFIVHWGKTRSETRGDRIPTSK